MGEAEDVGGDLIQLPAGKTSLERRHADWRRFWNRHALADDAKKRSERTVAVQPRPIAQIGAEVRHPCTILSVAGEAGAASVEDRISRGAVGNENDRHFADRCRCRRAVRGIAWHRGRVARASGVDGWCRERRICRRLARRIPARRQRGEERSGGECNSHTDATARPHVVQNFQPSSSSVLQAGHR